MSLPDSKLADAPRGVILEKPKANVYTMMMIASFVALVIGSLCLHGEMTAYEYDMKAAAAKAALTAAPPAIGPADAMPADGGVPAEGAPADGAAPPAGDVPADGAAPAAAAPPADGAAPPPAEADPAAAP